MNTLYASVVRATLGASLALAFVAGCGGRGGSSLDAGITNDEIIEYAAQGDVEMLRTMIEADPSLVNARGGPLAMTPLHAAVIKNQQQAIAFLLQNGANPNIRDAEGFTPSGRASQAGNRQLVTILDDAGAHMPRH